MMFRPPIQTVSRSGSSKLKYFSVCRSLSSKVPSKPVYSLKPDVTQLPQPPKIDLQVVEQLERISLVEFSNEAGLECLHSAVSSANLLHMVDTTGVEPLDSVLEDRELWLREDKVTEGNCQADILSNAVKVDEQYFVAPPGNIAMKRRDKKKFRKLLGKDGLNNE